MATLKDIAQQVGVSVSAVSLALRDHPSIGQETRKRIWDVKKKLGYELKSKSNGNIAFILLDRGFDVFTYARLFQSAGRLATENDLQPIYLSLSHASVLQGELPAVLQNRKVDGIIVSGAYDGAAHRILTSLGIPLLVCGNYQLGPEPWASCEVDLIEGMRLMMQRLTELGHERIGLLTCTPEGVEFGHQLRQNYLSLVTEFQRHSVGIACERDYEASPDQSALQQATSELLNRGRLSAIVAERGNLDVLDQCARQGLRVPQDISLVSLGAVMYETRPTLATVEANPVDLGRGIFEKLQRMMARPDYLITREHFPMRLIPGDSLGPIA